MSSKEIDVEYENYLSMFSNGGNEVPTVQEVFGPNANPPNPQLVGPDGTVITTNTNISFLVYSILYIEKEKNEGYNIIAILARVFQYSRECNLTRPDLTADIVTDTIHLLADKFYIPATGENTNTIISEIQTFSFPHPDIFFVNLKTYKNTLRNNGTNFTSDLSSLAFDVLLETLEVKYNNHDSTALDTFSSLTKLIAFEILLPPKKQI